VIILEKPNFPPYVCITCGTSTGRKWFVSLDFPLDNYFNPVNEGIIFQCNECWESLATLVAKEAQRFIIGQDPWDDPNYVKPTYDNVTQLVKEVDFGARSSHPSVALNSGPTELSNTEPTGSDPEPDTSDSVDEGTDSAIREFRVFFGDRDGE